MAYTRRNTTDGVTVMNKDLYGNLQDGIEEKPFYYNSVEEMKTDERLKEGMKAVTLGYYEPNDGGSATYLIMDKNNGLTQLDYIVLENGLYAVIITKGVRKYNVNQLGLIPSLDDCSIKLQDILDKTVHDSVLYFPRGNYNFKTPVTVKRVITFIGDSHILAPNFLYDNFGTIFNVISKNMANSYFLDSYTGSSQRVTYKNIIFKCDSFNMVEDRSKLIIDRFNVYQKTINTENVSCLNISYNSRIKECVFSGFSGVCVNSRAWNLIEDNYFENSNIGICTGIDSQVNRFRGNLLDIAIKINGSANIITNVRTDSISSHAIIFDDSNGNCEGNTLSNFDFDFVYFSAIKLNGRNNRITGNIGRCGCSCAGLEIEDLDLSEDMYKCCGIYCSNSNYNDYDNFIDVSLSYSQALDDTVQYKSPIIKIGLGGGGFTRYTINLSGSSPFNFDTKTKYAPGAVVSLSDFKHLINVEGKSLNFRGSLTHNGVTYHFNPLTGNFDTYNIFTDSEIPYSTTRDPSTAPPKIGLIARHNGLKAIYLSIGTSKGDWLKIADIPISS